MSNTGTQQKHLHGLDSLPHRKHVKKKKKGLHSKQTPALY